MKESDGSIEGCHPTLAAAHKQMAALYANEPREEGVDPETEQQPVELPKENLVRAVFPADLELREEATDGAMPTLTGHFAVFDQWTEISSAYEGRFLERIAPGAFKKTFQEQTPKVLFNHGKDPQIGDKVLGVPSLLEEDEQGARYEAPLLDTSYVRDLIPGLRAGAYGASFRFQVVKEEVNQEPEESDWNPRGLPERTIQEARVFELGPVTFPAYPGATAGVRSLTDDFLPGGRFATGPDGHAERAEQEPLPLEESETEDVPTTTVEEPTHSPVSRDTPPAEDRRANTDPEEEKLMDSIEEMRARQSEIKRELAEIAAENKGKLLEPNEQSRWDQLVAEREDLHKRVRATEERQAELERMAADDNHVEAGTPVADRSGTGIYVTHRAGRDQTPDDPFDMTSYHNRATSQEHMYRLLGEGAKRAIDSFEYPHPRATPEEVNTHIEKVLQGDSPDKEIAQRLLTTGSQTYRRAFWKQFSGQPLNNEETRALAVGAVATGQYAVPVQLDPTLIPTSDMHINPLRQISRVITTTSFKWTGVTSGGITASYAAEAAQASDNAPTLGQPAIEPERAQAFVPFSYEIGQDWATLESNIASELQDAKDYLEAWKFTCGSGHSSAEPKGILVAAGTVYNSNPAVGTTFAVGDVYRLQGQLPARYLSNASWVAHPSVYNLIRQFDTAGGANMWAQLPGPNPPTLLGDPAYRLTTFGSNVPQAGARYAIYGDFNHFLIVDRIGMSIRLIPDLFYTTPTTTGTAFPIGQSGFYAFWRNSSDVSTSNAFRVGTINQGG